jgi:hypothetical protein
LGRVELPVAVDRPVWEQRLLSDTFFVSYAKTALAMRTLGGLLGDDRLLRAVRAYVDEYRFRHPTGDDLRAVLERETGDELGWFFDGFLRDGHTPDWSVLGVRHTWIGQPEGMSLRDGEWLPVGDDPGGDSGDWLVDIDLGRRTELAGPVEVELTWETGRVERRVWDGKDRWIRWTESSPEVVIQVAVDPDGDWALETSRVDNYWRNEHWPRDPATAGPLWWLDGALRLIGLVTVPGS